MTRVTEALNATYVASLDVHQRRADVLEELRRQEDQTRKECDDSEVEKRLCSLSARKDNALRRLAECKEHLDVDQTSLESFLKNGARKLMAATTTAMLLHLVKELKIDANSLLRVHQTRLNRSKVDGELQTSLTG